MRKFFLKSFFFIFVISISLNLLGTLAERLAPLQDWRFYYQKLDAKLKAGNESIEAITLGNSHADSIDYSVLGIEGQSIAIAAADPFEIEKIALTLDQRLPHLNTAFIAISYYSFSWDNAKYQYLRPRRVGFYSMFPLWSPIEGDLANFIMGKVDAYTHVMSVVRSDSWQGVWPRLLVNAPVSDPFPYDGVITTSMWGECRHYTAEQLDRHAYEIAGKNVAVSMQMANFHPGLEQDAFAALARTIERLQSRGIRVVLYTPAYYDKYNEVFAENGSSVMDRMSMAVANLQGAYGVEYYDFSHEPDVTIHPELFYNSDHLNECGSKVVSTKLREKMSERNPLDR